MMTLWARMKICSLTTVVLLLLCAWVAWAQTQPATAPATPAQAAAPATPAPAMDMHLDAKAANAPSTDDLAKGPDLLLGVTARNQHIGRMPQRPQTALWIAP